MKPGNFPGQFNRGLFKSDSPAGARYGPGILCALLLHLPIGIGYLKAVGHEGPIGRKDWVTGVIGAVGSAVFGVAVPNMVMRDRNSPYAFTAKQMGPYDVDASNGAEGIEV